MTNKVKLEREEAWYNHIFAPVKPKTVKKGRALSQSKAKKNYARAEKDLLKAFGVK